VRIILTAGSTHCRSLAEVFRARLPGRLADELERTVAQMHRLVGEGPRAAGVGGEAHAGA